jgi:regulatory protein
MAVYYLMNHKITSLSLQKRNHQRVNVYLDGEFAFGLARIVAAWLKEGQEISDEKIEQLQAEDAREVAYQRAINYLKYRPRSEAELCQDLKKHNVSAEIISSTLERLRLGGLVNDEHFAHLWVENRSELHPRSRLAIAYELKKRGIDRQVIEQSLEPLDDEELAYQAGLKQARKFDRLEWLEFRKKLYGYLARRGFNYEACEAAVKRIWAEIHPVDQREKTTNEGAVL